MVVVVQYQVVSVADVATADTAATVIKVLLPWNIDSMRLEVG